MLSLFSILTVQVLAGQLLVPVSAHADLCDLKYGVIWRRSGCGEAKGRVPS